MFLQRRLEAPQTVTHREDFSRDIFVKITAVTHPPLPKGYWFNVKPKEAFRHVSDTATILSTPMLSIFQSLSVSPSENCEMALQEVFDSHDRLAFSCRVMHWGIRRGFHPMACVEVINNAGDVVSTAHLLQGNTLPSTEQVSDRKGCCTLEDNERAMLIRGSRDWGICIGTWKENDPWNKLHIKLFSLTETQGWISVSPDWKETFLVQLSKKIGLNVDLREGTIKIRPDVAHVPESIALGFAIAILYLLCQPFPVRTLEDDPNCRCPENLNRIRNEKLKFAVAVGYSADMFRPYIRSGTCQRCRQSRIVSKRFHSRSVSYSSNSWHFSSGGGRGGGFGGGGCGGGGCGGC